VTRSQVSSALLVITVVPRVAVDAALVPTVSSPIVSSVVRVPQGRTSRTRSLPIATTVQPPTSMERASVRRTIAPRTHVAMARAPPHLPASTALVTRTGEAIVVINWSPILVIATLASTAAFVRPHKPRTAAPSVVLVPMVISVIDAS